MNNQHVLKKMKSNEQVTNDEQTSDEQSTNIE